MRPKGYYLALGGFIGFTSSLMLENSSFRFYEGKFHYRISPLQRYSFGFSLPITSLGFLIGYLVYLHNVKKRK